MAEANEEKLKFNYYLASFFCFIACSLWHLMDEEGLLINTGKLTHQSPSPDYVAGLISDLAFDDLVGFSSTELDGRIQAVFEEADELIFEWLFHLENEAKSLAEEQICERFQFNILYLYYAFLAKVTRLSIDVISEIASQLGIAERQQDLYSKLEKAVDIIDSELNFVERVIDIEKDKGNLLSQRRFEISEKLASSWQESLTVAMTI